MNRGLYGFGVNQPTAGITSIVGANGLAVSTVNGVATISNTIQAAAGNPVSLTGSSVTVTGIPTWAKRVTICINGLRNVTGSTIPWLRLGSSVGGIETTGYLSAASLVLTANTTAATSSTVAFALATSLANTTIVDSTILTLVNTTGNTWMIVGVSGSNNVAGIYNTAGNKSLTNPLDRIQFLWSAAETFAASVTASVFWE